jgi:ornithine carbamoyltransferase
MRHFLRDDDLSPAEQAAVLDAAEAMVAAPHRDKPLEGPRSVAVLFEKPSLRTRVSFEVAIAELGGHAVILDAQTTHLGRGETIEDAGRVLSGYVDAIVIRTFHDERVAALSHASSVPVINALTDGFHPCQLLADLLTVRQLFGSTQGRTLAYVGDAAFNMANSYALAGAAAGMHVRIGAPAGYQPDPVIMARARAIASSTGGWVTVTDDPFDAVAGADVVATDTWTSMGQEASTERQAALMPYQLNATLLAAANPAAAVMHCLPAHRGEEITDEVMDGPTSVVFQQAANRVPAQKAVLAWLLRQARNAASGHNATASPSTGRAPVRDGLATPGDSVMSLMGSAA